MANNGALKSADRKNTLEREYDNIEIIFSEDRYSMYPDSDCLSVF